MFKNYTNGRMTVSACKVTEKNIDELTKLLEGKEIEGWKFIDKYKVIYSLGDAVKRKYYKEGSAVEALYYEPIRKKTFMKYKEVK